jgi:hypothetical protein
MKASSLAAIVRTVITGALVGACSCVGPSGDGAQREITGVEFAPAIVDLDVSRTVTVRIRNTSTRAFGPVELVSESIRDSTGADISTPRPGLVASPSEIPTLNPGTGRAIDVVIRDPAGLHAGRYTLQLGARLPDGSVLASLDINFRVEAAQHNTSVAAVRILSGPTSVRQGEVVQYVAQTLDSLGHVLKEGQVTWTVVPHGTGYAAPDGRFVGYEPGPAQVVASAGQVADTLLITILPREPSSQSGVSLRGTTR